jgi:hypothetical protein
MKRQVDIHRPREKRMNEDIMYDQLIDLMRFKGLFFHFLQSSPPFALPCMDLTFPFSPFWQSAVAPNRSLFSFYFPRRFS